MQQYAQCCEFSNLATRLKLPEALTQRNTQFLGIPRRLVLLVNDPACPDYSDIRRWKCAIYRLGVVPSTNQTAYINYTMIKVLLKISALLYTMSTAAQETNVSTVGFIRTCHISGVALEPTAAEKIPHL